MTAIMILLVVIAIRIEAESVTTVESFEFQRGRVAQDSFLNVKSEAANTMMLAFTENPAIYHVETKLLNFTKLIRQREDVELIYSVATFKPPNEFRVVVRNFLDEELNNVQVKYNLTDPPSTFSLGTLAIGEAKTGENLGVTPDSQKTIQVNVSYTTKSRGLDAKHIYNTLVGPAFNYTTTRADIFLASEKASFSDFFVITLFSNKSVSGSLPIL